MMLSFGLKKFAATIQYFVHLTGPNSSLWKLTHLDMLLEQLLHRNLRMVFIPLPFTQEASYVKAQGPLRCNLHEVVATSNDD